MPIRNFVSLAASLALSTLCAAQDNPLTLGTSGGSNARTGIFRVPYIFGDGSKIKIAWRLDLSLPGSAGRAPSRGAIVFDENGDLYSRIYRDAAFPSSRGGIFKIRASDGVVLWNGVIPDSTGSVAPPIVGRDAVYASNFLSSGTNHLVYALNRDTGKLLWQSDPLPSDVGLGMALQDGYLYGVTGAVGGNATLFCIQASNGATMWSTPIPAATTAIIMNVTLVKDAFGVGVHGLYWAFDGGTSATSGFRACRASPLSGSLAWSGGPNRNGVSHILFNAAKNALYSTHWADYGTTLDAYDPFSGHVRWTAWNDAPLGGNFNGGFFPCHTLRADGSGLIFAGFGGDLWSLKDPGDLSGSPLQAADICWFYDGADAAGESRSNAVTILDPQSGREIFVSGTGFSAEPVYARRLFAMVANTTNVSGERLWEWLRPNDPIASDGQTFRSLSVGPNGHLYYFDRNDGPAGSLIALGVRCDGDLNGDDFVDDTDFVIFVFAYNLLVCDDPAMPPDCPADLNGDGFVDDADFVVFVSAYDALLCP